MDNRPLLEKPSQSFNRDDLTWFMHASSGKFKPEKSNYCHYLEKPGFARDLVKLGSIHFEDGRCLNCLIVPAAGFERAYTGLRGRKHSPPRRRLSEWKKDRRASESIV